MTLTVHRAGWVMVDPGTILRNARVVLGGGQVLEVERASVPGVFGQGTHVDHGPGLIMPGLVNAHTHLSLSALRGKIAVVRGFQTWVEELLEIRMTLPPQAAAATALHEARRMRAQGTALAAEVGPVEPGLEAMCGGGLGGVVFVESLGAAENPEDLPAELPGLHCSWAAHGPHTTSPGRMAALKRAAGGQGRPFMLHLAESEVETEFLTAGKGPWAELMQRRGHDLAQWAPFGERPVTRALRLGLLDPMTLAVHLLDVTPPEMDALALSGVRVCLCPRSNLALHGRFPDVAGWLARGVRPALGTDSLASVPTLDLLDELACLAQHAPDIEPETLVAMATMNGAAALGFPGQGSLHPGSTARPLYVDLEAGGTRQLLERLVNGALSGVRWCTFPSRPQACAVNGAEGEFIGL